MPQLDFDISAALTADTQSAFDAAIKALEAPLAGWREAPLPHFTLPEKTDDLPDLRDMAADMAVAFATVAFVAFISMLVDRTYTATQYALLASIGTAGRTTLAASSGALVDWLNGDWGIFFIITAVMVVPSLIFLYLIKDKLKLND